ncbi:MAG: glycosyltransferase family 2 protein [bacterium JZ-2024 1]
MSPEITVITVLYQPEKEVLRKFFHSLSQQSEPFELIVVDNHSQDSSFLDLVPPNAVFHRFSRNLGYAQAVNWALHIAKTPYALITNFDVVLEKDCLGEMRCCLERRPEAAGVCPKSYLADYPGILDSVGIVLDSFLQASNRGIGMMDIGQFDTEEQLPCLSFSCVLLRMDVVKKIGGLHPSFFLYYEDVEWCLRAVEAGYSFFSCPRAKIQHLHSASARRALPPDIKRFLLRSNLLRTAFLHLPLPDFFHILGFHFLLFFPFRLPYSFAIFLDFFLHFPYLLWERAQHRKINWTTFLREDMGKWDLFDSVSLRPIGGVPCLAGSIDKLWEIEPKKECFLLLQKMLAGISRQ